VGVARIIPMTVERKLKESFQCITVGCDGTLEFIGSGIEHNAAYKCEECGLILNVVSPPKEE
jgi:hypothetical protein